MARIILVDDDPLVLCAAGVMLRDGGHEVCLADGPAAAAELAAEFLPDLMIVDVVMPEDTEGFQLVWKIRQSDQAQLRDVPIVMATGPDELTELHFFPEHSDGTCDPREALPIQGWLDKPFKPAELLAAVARALGDSQPSRGG